MLQGKKESINQAYELILNDIVLHKLKPGEWLKERDICEMAGVGRSSVRNAFDLLSQRGLLVREPNKGVRVISFTRTQIEHLLVAKNQIEVSVLNKTYMAYQENDFRRLTGIIGSISEAIRTREFINYLNQVGRFHNAIVGKLGNEYYSEIFQMLMSRYIVFEMLYDTFYQIDVEQFTVVKGYKDICLAIRNRAPAMAERVLSDMASRTLAYFDASAANESEYGQSYIL